MSWQAFWLAFQVPLDNSFGHEAHHPESQANEDDKRAELACFGFPCQMANDEQHVQHEAAHAEGEAKACNLFF